MPKSEKPMAASAIAAIVLAVIATIALTVFTAGAGVAAGAVVLPIIEVGWTVATVGFSVSVPVTAGVIAAGTVAGLNSANEKNVKFTDNSDEFYKDFRLQQWNYEEHITTEFDPNKFTCEKCVVSRNCKVRDDAENICIEWEEESEPDCKTVQF